HGSGLRGWLDALAQLALAGVPVRAGWLLRGRKAVDAVRTPAPKQPGWTVDGQLVRTADGKPVAGGLTPARRVAQLPGSSTFPLSLDSSEANVTTNPHQGQDALIAEFLRTSREMIAAQRDVLLTYFGAGAGAVERPAAPPMPILEATPVPQRPVEAAPVVTPAPAPAPEAVDVGQVVLDIISERTGYPVDMIEPDLDLEADLSIDSIKRAEIAGELARRLGGSTDLAGLADDELEELTKARTAAAVTDWLTSRLSGPVAAEEPVQAEEPVTGQAPKRLVLQPVLLDTGNHPASQLAGTHWVLLGDEGTDIADRLTAHGAEVTVQDMEHLLTEADGPVDGVIYLGAADGVPVLPDAFAVLKAALAREPKWLLAVRPVDGDAVGLRGLFRSAAREYPGTVARVVDVDEDVADTVIGEILADDTSPAVVWRAVGRHGFELAEAPLGALGSTGAGPAGDGVAEAAAL
ncbi:acyl carrier protein, partial [Streptomyces acidiscabies]